MRVIESLAILDYLESKYPQPSLLPKNPTQLAKVRMAQMVANSELSSLVVPLIGESEGSPKLAQAKRKIKRIFKFMTELLGEDNYFGGDDLSVGDIVAGNNILLVNKLGFDLSQFVQIEKYCPKGLASRPIA